MKYDDFLKVFEYIAVINLMPEKPVADVNLQNVGRFFILNRSFKTIYSILFCIIFFQVGNFEEKVCKYSVCLFVF